MLAEINQLHAQALALQACMQFQLLEFYQNCPESARGAATQLFYAHQELDQLITQFQQDFNSATLSTRDYWLEYTTQYSNYCKKLHSLFTLYPYLYPSILDQQRCSLFETAENLRQKFSRTKNEDLIVEFSRDTRAIFG